MHLPTSVLILTTTLTTALSIPHLSLFPSQTPLQQTETETTYRIPTLHESAIQARRILHLESIGTLSTIFPSTSSTLQDGLQETKQVHSRARDEDVEALERRPPTVAGLPFGSMDYFGDCEPLTGNPTILQLDIGTSFKNAAAGSNVTLSLRYHPQAYTHYSAASLPRFSLFGYLEEFTADEVEESGVEQCYTQYHPDAVAWLPGNAIHTARWVRLVVQEVYAIMGFGDRAYIGWVPLEAWKNVTKEEIEACRLPGESKSSAFFGLGDW